MKFVLWSFSPANCTASSKYPRICSNSVGKEFFLDSFGIYIVFNSFFPVFWFNAIPNFRKTGGFSPGLRSSALSLLHLRLARVSEQDPKPPVSQKSHWLFTNTVVEFLQGNWPRWFPRATFVRRPRCRIFKFMLWMCLMVELFSETFFFLPSNSKCQLQLFALHPCFSNFLEFSRNYNPFLDTNKDSNK